MDAIGIFDSGVGGLTVMKALIEFLPNENLIYFGDTARVPYGSKSPDTIRRYSIENSLFLINHGIKALVIACNTASAVSLDHLPQLLRVPVVDVISTNIEYIRSLSPKSKKLGILATRTTIESKVYEKFLKRAIPELDLFSLSCPLFVPLIEEQLLERSFIEHVLKDVLQPMIEYHPDIILLGCTHYPLLLPLLKKILGEQVIFIDSAHPCAQKIKTYLDEEGKAKTKNSQPTYKFFVSDDPLRFKEQGSIFLGTQIDHVEKVSTYF